LISDSPRLPILLASDFPIFRESLKAHFEKATEIELVACANNKNEVIPLLQSHKPKLVLLDLNIDWDDLCALLDGIHAHNDVRSLIMSDDLPSSRVIQLLRHGAHGVVPRRTTQDLFTKSIVTVLAGHFWVSRAMITDFVHLIRQNGPGDRQKMSDAGENEASGFRASEAEIARFGLTPREMQIIGALVDGQTNKDIATTFGISEYTVKHHLTNIYDKLGVYNRVELVLFAINHRLCSAPGTLVLPDGM
jgi:two-component system, NarL family, nitrate/nitrite response regulator NarL